MSAITLTCTPIRIIWRADDGSHAIARVRLEGGGETVASGPGDLTPGLETRTRLNLIGKWADHPKYGRQFEFAAYTAALAADRKGVVQYLVALVDGVGEATAARLWDRYGERAVETLRERPATVATDGILPADVAFRAAATLEKEAKYEQTKIDLVGLLGGRGFQLGAVVKEVIALWDTRAPDVIRRNPYALLLKKVTSCGWKRCDALYLDLGHDPARLKRQALAALWIIGEQRDGHTWHDAKSIGEAITRQIGDAARPFDAIRMLLRKGLVAIWRKGEERYLALRDDARNESALAMKITEAAAWTGKRRSSGRTHTMPSPAAT
jgi:exodeoxyribonuclease V alpha subunit